MRITGLKAIDTHCDDFLNIKTNVTTLISNRKLFLFQSVYRILLCHQHCKSPYPKYLE